MCWQDRVSKREKKVGQGIQQYDNYTLVQNTDMLVSYEEKLPN